jgi:hypothetical protein
LDKILKEIKDILEKEFVGVLYGVRIFIDKELPPNCFCFEYEEKKHYFFMIWLMIK